MFLKEPNERDEQPDSGPFIPHLPYGNGADVGFAKNRSSIELVIELLPAAFKRARNAEAETVVRI